MPRTAGGLRSDPTTRLAEVARQRPEWQGWIGLLNVARRALDDGPWTLALGPAYASESASQREPLLHHRTLEADARKAQALIEHLALSAAEMEAGPLVAGLRLFPADSLRLIAAAITRDTDTFELLANQQGLDAAALESLAHMAALPLLQACSQQLQGLLP